MKINKITTDSSFPTVPFSRQQLFYRQFFHRTTFFRRQFRSWTEDKNTTALNSKFALCGLTFMFQNLYLRFKFVMADNFVFQNPAHRKLGGRYGQVYETTTKRQQTDKKTTKG